MRITPLDELRWVVLKTSKRPLRVFMGLVLVLFSFDAFSATITSKVAGGNWATAGTWVGDAVPLATDDVIIAGPVTVAANATCTGVVINNGFTLTQNTATTLFVNGTWLNNGVYDPGGSGTATVTFGATSAINPGTGTANFRNLSIAAAANLTINTNVTAAGTFIFAAVTATSRVTLTGTFTITVTGAMTMPQPSSTMTCTMDVGDGTLTVGGLFTMAAGTVSAGARTDSLLIDEGDVNFNNGVTTGTSGSVIKFTADGTLNMAGTISTGPPAIIEATGTINFKGTAAQSIWTETYYNLLVSGSSTKTLRGTTTVINLLTIDLGNTLFLSTFTLAFPNAGPYFVNNGTLDVGTGTFSFTGTGPQDIPDIAYHHLTFTNGGVKTITSGSTLTVGGNWANSSPVTMTGDTDANIGGIVSGSGAFTFGSGTITVGGNWTNSGVTVPGNSHVILGSASPQTIRGNFYQLTLTGGGAKTLTSTTVVSNLLTIDSGNTLTLTTSALTLSGTNAFVPGAGTLDPGVATAVISFTGPDPETIPNLAYRNLTFGGAGVKTIAAGTTLNIALAWVIGAPTVIEGDANVNVGTSTSGSGTLTMGTGTLTISTGSFASGTFTPGQGTVHFARNDGTAQTVRNTTYYNLEVSGTSIKNLSNTSVVTNKLKVDGSTFNFGVRAISFSGGGDPIEFVNGGIYSGTTGLTSFTSVDPQNVPGLAYGGLTFSGAGTKTLTGDATVNGTFTNSSTSIIEDNLTLNITGSWTNNNPMTLTDAANVTLTGSISGNGTITMGTGTITVGTNWTAGVLVPNSGRVHYNGAGAQAVRGLNYYDLEFSGAGTKTIATATTATIGNNWIVDSPVTMTGTAGANVTGNISGAGSITQNTGTIALEGNWTNSGTFTSATTGIVLYDGANPQVVAGLAYARLQFAAAGLKTLADDASVSNVLTFNTAATFNLSSHTLTLSAGGTPLVAGTGTLEPATSTVLYSSASATNIAALNYYNLDGTGGVRTLPSSGTVGIANIFTPGAGAYTTTNSTVHFNGAGEQTIPAFNYHHLNGTGGNRILAPGETIGIAGVFTPGAGLYTVASNTVNFNGTTDQTIPAFTFNQVILSGSGQKIIDTVVTTGQIEIANGPTLNLNSTAGGILNVTN